MKWKGYFSGLIHLLILYLQNFPLHSIYSCNTLYVSNHDNVVSVFGIESGVAPPLPLAGTSSGNSSQQQLLANKPFLEMIVNTLQCSENDYAALFALCLLYALGHNPGTARKREKSCNLFLQEL